MLACRVDTPGKKAGDPRVGVRVSLQLGPTAQGVYHACKFRQHSVASVLHDATAMLLDLRISQLAEMRLEPLVRPSSSAPISRQ